MKDSLSSLNNLRNKDWKKPEADEQFLLRLNESLAQFEVGLTIENTDTFPLLFVVGAPRSGTTFCTQILQQSFNLGYINNFMARFWKAPVTGIHFSKQVLGNQTFDELSSNYASTNGLTGIHEFGYFWRNWLSKESAKDFVHFKEREKNIEWASLSSTISNILHFIGRPMVMKNNFGGFHIDKLLEELPTAMFIYIKRNPVDNAISILDARHSFFDDPATWWSTISPNYFEIKNLPVHEQIAEQILSLDELYLSQMENGTFMERKITINYEELVENTPVVLNSIKNQLEKTFGQSFPLDIKHDSLKRRSYSDRINDREIFNKLIAEKL